MEDLSNPVLHLDIYEEELNQDTTCDCSNQGLEVVPKIDNKLLCVLYLQNNKIKSLPEEFFTSLTGLMWLDLRDNLLTEIPKSIKNHPCLTHLLLQNNKISSLPLELGSVITLKVLQLNGNPLAFPPKDIINAGVSSIIKFLHEKYVDNIFNKSEYEENESLNENYQVDTYNHDVLSYNSVIDGDKAKSNVTVKFTEKESDDSEDEYYAKIKGKCPKLPKSRAKTLPPYYQSAKYLKPLLADSYSAQTEKIKRNYIKEVTLKKHKNILATRERILQDKKNMEQLKDWRNLYRVRKSTVDKSYRIDPTNFPYDTNPDFMHLLSREDIEKDLPDKFKKKLLRRSRPTVPRKSNNDVHLALKIKQLFENLEAIDMNKDGLTPRTEQKVLMNEIQKITEIKQKLTELSLTNSRSVALD